MLSFGYRKVAQPGRRNIYSAASAGRLYAGWGTTNYSADQELWGTLSAMRARSRDMERNNDYARRFFGMVRANVVGDKGIQFQSKVMNGQKPDELARLRIEEAFAEWQLRGNCDVTGNYSYKDIQNLIISSVARDGEVLVRKVRGFDNPFGFALQLIEADHLDENQNDVLPNGNRLRMGIELDGWSRPVAYWVSKTHPGDNTFATVTRDDLMRIPAEEIQHIFVPVRISQRRGIPWMHSALTRLQMIGAYEEAELVAARIAAAKSGFFTSESGDEYVGDAVENDAPISEVEPGVFETLPRGMGFQPFDPQHPTTQFEAFIKAILRGVASGLEISYNTLANDLEGVNFSSLRKGALDERDVWRCLQQFMIDHHSIDLFHSWLPMALLTGKVNLPQSKIEKFKAHTWQPRGWQWVDPQKEIQSQLLAMGAGLNSATAIAAEQGRDLEEIYADLAREIELRKKFNLTLSQLEVTPATDGGNDAQQDN